MSRTLSSETSNGLLDESKEVGGDGDPMSVGDFIAVALIGPAIVIGGLVLVVPSAWRGRRDFYERNIIAHVLIGRHGRDGFNASLPTVVVSASLLYVGVAALAARSVLPDIFNRVLTIVAAISVAAMMLGLLVTISIIAFMRPKFLAPPHLRERAGLIRSLLNNKGSSNPQ